MTASDPKKKPPRYTWNPECSGGCGNTMEVDSPGQTWMCTGCRRRLNWPNVGPNPKPARSGVTASDTPEPFAKYHDERAGYGGAGFEFHARAASFLRTQAEALTAARARIEQLEHANEEWASRASEQNVAALQDENDALRDRVRVLETAARKALGAVSIERIRGLLDHALASPTPPESEEGRS